MTALSVSSSMSVSSASTCSPSPLTQLAITPSVIDSPNDGILISTASAIAFRCLLSA